MKIEGTKDKDTFIKEEQLRPPDLLKEAIRLEKEDIALLLAHKEDFVRVNCPACDQDAANYTFDKGGFSFWECSRCGTLYVSPRPTAEMLTEFYRTAESVAFWNRHIFPASESVRKDRIFRGRVERLAAVLNGRRVESLVDVGAGFGWFVGLCAENGVARRAIGVEPSPELAASCRKFPDVEVIEAPIEDCYHLLNADVITSFELIEHLFDARDFLTACFNGLKPGGLFLCTTPNWWGLDLQVLRERSSNVGAPKHLNYFTPSSLDALLSRIGFVDVRVTTPGELDVDILYNQMQAGTITPGEFPAFGSFILEASTEAKSDLQRFLQRHNLSSNMMAIARRPIASTG